jgi:hypothetical protein
MEIISFPSVLRSLIQLLANLSWSNPFLHHLELSRIQQVRHFEILRDDNTSLQLLLVEGILVDEEGCGLEDLLQLLGRDLAMVIVDLLKNLLALACLRNYFCHHFQNLMDILGYLIKSYLLYLLHVLFMIPQAVRAQHSIMQCTFESDRLQIMLTAIHLQRISLEFGGSFI